MLEDSAVLTYNTFNQLIHKIIYQFPNQGNTQISEMDSLTYDTNGGKILVHKYFVVDPNSNQTIPAQKREFYYTTSGEIDYIESFVYSFVTDGLEWTGRKKYNLQGGLPVSILNYAVSNGFLQTEPSTENYYSYNLDGNLEQRLHIHLGDSVFAVNYNYLNKDFASEQYGFFFTTPGVTINSWSLRYNYQSTLSLDAVLHVNSLIFPNPAKDHVEVRVDGELLTLEIFNLKGQKLLQQNEAVMDVSHLPPGTYIVKGTSTLGEFSEKLIVE